MHIRLCEAKNKQFNLLKGIFITKNIYFNSMCSLLRR